MRPRLLRLLIGGLFALLCAQMLYGALMFSALYNQYEKPTVKVAGLLCNDIAEHLSLLVRVGKSLRPQTVTRFLEPYRARSSAFLIAVTDEDGQILGDSSTETTELTTPEEAVPLFGSLKRFSDEKYIWTTAPILDRKNEVEGHAYLAVEKHDIIATVMKTAHPQIGLFIGITAGECLLLALLLVCVLRASGGRPLTAGRLRISFMLPLILGQGLFLILLHSPITRHYQQEMVQTGRQLGMHLVWDLERISGMGLPISAIQNMDDWLVKRQSHVDTLGMAVYDENGLLHSAASSQGILTPTRWQDFSSTSNIIMRDVVNPKTGNFCGGIFVAMDADAVAKNIRSVMLDNLTLTIIAALFLSELIFLLLLSEGPAGTYSASARFMRPIIFAALFATELSTSYVPICIGELGLDLFGLPPDIVSGLPVSCELFMAGAAMLLGGFWSQRSGWRPMLIAGIVLAAGGAFFSWTAHSALSFILARGMAGLGYGFINLAAQVFVIAHSTDQNRAANLAFMFAGLYAGTLCGSAMGGLIADRLGYIAVFPVTAVLLALLAVLLWYALPRECWIREKRGKGFSRAKAMAFLCDRRMAALLLFFIIPNALLTVCLFQFFIPLSLNEAGESPAAIGRVFLVYCLIVMFAGPFFGRLIDRSQRMEIPLAISLAIACASMLVPVILDGMTAALLCVALLAVNTAIASNGQGAYALSLPAASRFGRSQTMGFYNVAMRLGQVLGPLTMGIMMTVWDAKTGLILLASASATCAVLFLMLSAMPKRPYRRQ